jgi:hypothetical protein
MLDINYAWIVLERVGEIVLNNVQGCVLELGGGKSSWVMVELARKFDRKFYMCDSSPYTCQQVRDGVKYEKMEIIRDNSTHFIWDFKDTPAVVFHDCCHRWKTARKETFKLLEIMSPGGVLFVHDTTPPKWRYEQKIARGRTSDMWKYRKEMEERKDIDVFTWRYTAADCGLTMILKKDMTEPEYRT